jgi:hypothetical protein
MILMQAVNFSHIKDLGLSLVSFLLLNQETVFK